MKLRQGTNAVRREELAFVQHELQNAPQLVRLAMESSRRSPIPSVRMQARFARQVRTVVNEPFQASLEIGQLVEHIRFQRLDGKQRDQSHHGANLHGKLRCRRAA